MQTIFDTECTTREIFEDLSKKWTIIVVMLLNNNPQRFGELQKRAQGISQKMLTQTLRTLQSNGLVYRDVDSSTIPITVTYSLTTLGESLVPSLVTFRSWVERHATEMQQAREQS